MLKQGCCDMVTDRNGDNLTQDLIFRSYWPRDEEKIVELLETVFGDWPGFCLNCSPLEHWRWKYLDNPVGQSQIAVCLKNDEMIGCAHLIPLRLKIEDAVYPSCYGTDVAVHPDYRGLGIYNRLNSLRHDLATKAGYLHSFHPTRNPILLRHHRKYWQTFPHDILNFVKIYDIDRQLEAMPMKNRWMMKFGFLGAHYLNKLRNSLSKYKFEEYQGKIITTSAFNDKINDFWEATSSQYDFIFERRLRNLNWRYSDSRAGKFIVLQAMGEDNIQGYAVLSINRKIENYPVGFIMDLISLPNRRDVVRALLLNALEEFEKHGVNLVNCLIVNNSQYEDVLKKSEFLNSRVKLQLFYYSMEKKHQKIYLKMF